MAIHTESFMNCTGEDEVAMAKYETAVLTPSQAETSQLTMKSAQEGAEERERLNDLA